MINSKYILVLRGFFSNFKHKLGQITHVDHRNTIRQRVLHVFLQPGGLEVLIERELLVSVEHARAQHKTLEVGLGLAGAQAEGFSRDQVLEFGGRSAQCVLGLHVPHIGRAFFFFLAVALDVRFLVHELGVVRFLLFFLRRAGPGHHAGDTNQEFFSLGLFELLNSEFQLLVVTGLQVVDDHV